GNGQASGLRSVPPMWKPLPTSRKASRRRRQIAQGDFAGVEFAAGAAEGAVQFGHFRAGGRKRKEPAQGGSHTAPALITLDGHRLSSLYRARILAPESSWFKYSGERARLASRWRVAIAERHRVEETKPVPSDRFFENGLRRIRVFG